jgi:hypothetical protein
VEALGGSIVVESEPTRGSRFAIVLPEAPEGMAGASALPPLGARKESVR